LISSAAAASSSSSRTMTPEINFLAPEKVASSSRTPSPSLPLPARKTRAQTSALSSGATKGPRRCSTRANPQLALLWQHKEEQMRLLESARRTLRAVAQQEGIFDGSKKRKHTDDELVQAIWPPVGPQCTGAVRALSRITRKLQLLDELALKLEAIAESTPSSPEPESHPERESVPTRATIAEQAPSEEPPVSHPAPAGPAEPSSVEADSNPEPVPSSSASNCADTDNEALQVESILEATPDSDEKPQPRKRRRVAKSVPSDAPARSTRSRGRPAVS